MVFSVTSQLMIVTPILPMIGSELGVADSLLGTLITSYAIAVAIFALITGPISDRFGRRSIIVCGVAGMTVALVLHGLAWSFATLLVARALAGAAGGVLGGAGVAYVGDYFPPERRGWATGWVMSGLATGQIAGIPLGTLLASWLGFRAPFLAFALTMALTLLLVWRFLPHPPAQRSEDPLSVRSALVNYWHLLKNTQVVASTLVFLLTFIGLAFYVTYLPKWLVDSELATDYTLAGLFFFSGLVYVVGGVQAGKLSDRAGRQAVILAACFALVVIMPVTSYVPDSLWLLTACFSVSLGLFAARATPLQALLTEIVPSERRGSLMALVLSIGQLGFGAGGALSGVIYSRYGYATSAWLAAVSVLATVFLVWRYLPDPVPEASDPALSGQ